MPLSKEYIKKAKEKGWQLHDTDGDGKYDFCEEINLKKASESFDALLPALKKCMEGKL
jgi:hypothetical protein